MSARHWRWLAAILVLAALIRLPAVLVNPVVSVDETRYLRLAEAAPAHPELLLLHNYHPAYPAALVPVVAMAPAAPERPARLFSLLLGLVSLIALWGLARERFGAEVALVAAALFALYPGPIEASGRILSESIYLPAVLGSCWALLRLIRSGGFGAAVGFGALAGLAYLTRPEGLAPAVVGLGWLAIGGSLSIGHDARRASRGRRLAVLGVAALSLAVVAGPYVVSIGGLTRKKAIGISALDAGHESQGASRAMQELRAHWIGTADVPSSERSPVAEFAHEWISSATPIFWVVAIVGLLCLVRRRQRLAPADWMLTGVIGLYLAAHVFVLMRAGYLSSRHVWPVACLALPWLAAAVWHVLHWRPEQRPWSGRLLGGAVLGGFALLALSASAWPWRSERPYLRDSGLYLRTQGASEGAVLATDPRVAYYARSKSLIIGRGSWADLLEGARNGGARWIACEEADLVDRAIGFDVAAPTGVRLSREFPMPPRRGRPAGRFLIYEILRNK